MNTYIPNPFNENYDSNAKRASIMAAYKCEMSGVYGNEDMDLRAKLYCDYYEYYLNRDITEEELDIAREFIK